MDTGIFQPIIQQVVLALIGLLTMFALAILTELRIRIKRWIDTRQSAAEREILHRLAEEGFAIVEQTMKSSTAQDKLFAAMTYITKQAEAKGIKVDPETVRATIEKTVTEYNKHRKPA